jgi:anaerobic magnesium-protoporphyrin IX monomethyl ester cyclase
MSKVLFCFPPPEDDLVMPRGGNSDLMYGLGIPYLMSYLDRGGHTTDALIEVYDTWDEWYPKFVTKMNSFRPDYVGIQVYSMNRINSFKIVKVCQDLGIPCFVGDAHITALAEKVCEHYHVTCVIGEGEVTVSEIVSDKPLASISGICWWDGGKAVMNPKRELIADLDTIPFPRHDLFMKNPDQKLASLFTSRGCPMKCSFCCLKQMRDRKVRYRSVENVIAEIKWLKETYPHLERIIFLDDTFTLNAKRVIAMCDALIEADLGITFIMAGTVKGNTPEMFNHMEKAGLEHLYVGLESGSQSLLDRAQKNLKLSEVEQLFTNAKGHPRLVISTYLITGLPGETWGTVGETVEFVKKLQRISYNYVDFSTIIWAYPGTEIYEQMKEAGKITDDYWFEDKPCPNWTVEHDLHELREMQQYLLNRVSFTRIFTPIGLYHQMANAPIQVISFAYHHPRFIKYALGESFGYMFPLLYQKIRGYKLQKRWLDAGD